MPALHVRSTAVACSACHPLEYVDLNNQHPFLRIHLRPSPKPVISPRPEDLQDSRNAFVFESSLPTARTYTEVYGQRPAAAFLYVGPALHAIDTGPCEEVGRPGAERIHERLLNPWMLHAASQTPEERRLPQVLARMQLSGQPASATVEGGQGVLSDARRQGYMTALWSGKAVAIMGSRPLKPSFLSAETTARPIIWRAPDRNSPGWFRLLGYFIHRYNARAHQLLIEALNFPHLILNLHKYQQRQEDVDLEHTWQRIFGRLEAAGHSEGYRCLKRRLLYARHRIRQLLVRACIDMTVASPNDSARWDSLVGDMYKLDPEERLRHEKCRRVMRRTLTEQLICVNVPDVNPRMRTCIYESLGGQHQQGTKGPAEHGGGERPEESVNQARHVNGILLNPALADLDSPFRRDRRLQVDTEEELLSISRIRKLSSLERHLADLFI
ncbi:hypothetical protein BDW22DRAFT_1348944 [Trametopsis cervina]|nr:hypothetical protein BDW22DRAFT_1348944 [Trametopsis cervina]